MVAGFELVICPPKAFVCAEPMAAGLDEVAKVTEGGLLGVAGWKLTLVPLVWLASFHAFIALATLEKSMEIGYGDASPFTTPPGTEAG